MTTLSINGKKVKVSDDFLSLSPEEQNRTVEEIAKGMGVAPQTAAPPVVSPAAPAEKPDAMARGLSTLSDMTRNPTVQPDDRAMTAQDMLAASAATPGGVSTAQMDAMGAPPSPGMVYDPRTKMNLPEKVTAADGTVLFLNPDNSTYSSEGMMAEGMKPGAGKAFQAGAASGVTMGWGDDLVGAVLGEREGAKIRAMTEAARRDRPGMTLAGEVAGAVAVPVPVKGGATLKEAVKEGAKLGAKLGFVYGSGNADGGVVERVKGGLEGAISGGLFGAAAPVAVNFGSKAFQKLFGKSAERPTLESLKATKTAAYNAVESAGEKFGPDDIKALSAAATSRMDDVNFLPEVDDQTAAVLKRLDLLSNRELTIGQVDKLRRDVWDRYSKTKELGLLEVIDSIDEMVAARTSTSELMDAARVANARYKKAELLDLAFQKAADQTAATGSGGNVLNKMRQAVTQIINNPKQAKWFSAAEIDTMRAFVQGSASENVLRQVGKLAPTGNGLMTALNLLGGATFGAPALAVTGLASGAKAIADRSTERGAQRLIGMVAGQQAAPQVSAPISGSAFVRSAGPMGNALAPR